MRLPALLQRVLLPLLLSACPAAGQDRARAPQRSIAVLVDVSSSVSAAYSLEARQIIEDVVTGAGFRPTDGWVSNYASPEPLDPKGEDEFIIDAGLKSLFQPYWEGGAGGLPALTAPGKIFRLGRIGLTSTTLKEEKPYQIYDAGQIPGLLDAAYPKTEREYKDGYTCYKMGVVRMSQGLLTTGDRNCYLFIVSDEKDDPDYKKPGAGEWKDHLMAADGMSDSTALNYSRFVTDELSKLRREDRFSLIARWHKGDRNNASGRKYLRLSWYAIGDKPVPVPPPVKEEPRKPEDPPPPPKPKAPVFQPVLTLLGGLPAADPSDETKPTSAAGIKTFPIAAPFLAWQVDNAPHLAADPEMEVLVEEATGSGLQKKHHIKPNQLSYVRGGRLRGLPGGTTALPPLANGVYRITIQEKPPAAGEKAAGIKPAVTWIEIKQSFDWLPWALTASLVCAAGVVGYSLWSLRK